MRRAVGMLGQGGLLRRFSLVDGMNQRRGEMTNPSFAKGPCLSNQRRRRGNRPGHETALGLRRIAAVINQQKGGGPCVMRGGRVQLGVSSTPSPFLRDGNVLVLVADSQRNCASFVGGVSSPTVRSLGRVRNSPEHTYMFPHSEARD